MSKVSPLVVLTGATGFVGRQVLRAAVEQKCKVRVVAREGKEDQVFGAEVVTAPDIWAENTTWWSNVCRGADIVIHVAWYAEPGQYLQSPTNLDCLVGTLRLAKGAIDANVKRFVGIGTCFEYDVSVGQLSIETPIKPLTVYAATKASAFLTLSQTLPPAGISFLWCRLFYLFGEGENDRRLVPYLRSRLDAGEPADLSSGNQIRDFLDVRDAGRMIVEAALGSSEGPVNICSGVPMTVRELAEQIADEYGRRDLLRFGARPDNIFDPPCVVGVREPGNPLV